MGHFTTEREPLTPLERALTTRSEAGLAEASEILREELRDPKCLYQDIATANGMLDFRGIDWNVKLTAGNEVQIVDACGKVISEVGKLKGCQQEAVQLTPAQLPAVAPNELIEQPPVFEKATCIAPPISIGGPTSFLPPPTIRVDQSLPQRFILSHQHADSNYGRIELNSRHLSAEFEVGSRNYRQVNIDQQLATDMAYGKTREAVTILQQIQRDGTAQTEVQWADQEASRIAASQHRFLPEHAVPTGFGQFAIVDQAGRQIANTSTSAENFYAPLQTQGQLNVGSPYEEFHPVAPVVNTGFSIGIGSYHRRRR